MRVTARTRVAVAAAALVVAHATVASAAPTSKPANIHVTSSTASELWLAWDPPAEAGIVGAHVSAHSTGSAVLYLAKVGDTPTLTTGHVAGLGCGTTYSISVQWNDGATAGPAGSATGTTAACTKPPPAAPSGLSATPLAANSIRFDWTDTPDASVIDAAYSVTGPLKDDAALPLYRVGHVTSAQIDDLVCGQPYTFTLSWVNDEGSPSGTASTQATTLPCSTAAPPGPPPAGLQVTESSTSGFTLAWEAAPSATVGYRLTTSGPGVDTTAFDKPSTSGATYARSRFTAQCAQTYTFTVAWVYKDGGISQPATVNGTAPACPAPLPPLPDPTLAPEDTVPPVVTVGARSLRANRKGALLIPLACAKGEDHCTGTLKLAPGHNARGIRLPRVCGSATFRLAGGGKRVVTVRLRAAAVATLRRAHAVHLKLTVVAHDDSGNKATRTLGLRVKAPARR